MKFYIIYRVFKYFSNFIEFKGQKIRSVFDTLDYILLCISSKSKGAYLRFGDGDIYLLFGRNDTHQIANSKIKAEMREAFRLSGNGIIKTLPLHSKYFGYEKKYGIWKSFSSELESKIFFHQCRK